MLVRYAQKGAPQLSRIPSYENASTRGTNDRAASSYLWNHRIELWSRSQRSAVTAPVVLALGDTVRINITVRLIGDAK